MDLKKLNRTLEESIRILEEDKVHTIMLEAKSKVNESIIPNIQKWVDAEPRNTIGDISFEMVEGHIIIPKDIVTQEVVDRYTYEDKWEVGEEIREWFWMSYEEKGSKDIPKGHWVALMFDASIMGKPAKDIKTALNNFIKEERDWFKSIGVKVKTKVKLTKATGSEAEHTNDSIGWEYLYTEFDLTDSHMSLLGKIKDSDESYKPDSYDTKYYIPKMEKNGLVVSQGGGYVITPKGEKLLAKGW